MMKMIDVMKRLAELDATNPSIEKSNLAECGPMGIMDSMSGAPSTPASINMTAGSGPELSGMLKDIMSLAGLSKVEPEHLGMEHEPTIMTAEPVTSVGPTSDTEVMRGVIDKLNPEMDDEEGDEEGEELSSFQQDDEEETDEGAIGAGLGGMAGGSLGQMGGAALGGMLGGPIGAALGGVAGDVVGTGMGSQAGDKMTGEEYDNSPADPRKPPPFKANQFANRANQPGQGDRMDGTSPKAYADMNEAVADLFAEYKKFVSESEEDEDMEEGIEDRLKDLDPKNPVNVPAYQRKAASGDSADAARNTKEGATEKFDPLKHVKNPTQGEKDAAKDVKRGSYADRAAMLRSAEADGRLTVDQARANKKERMRNDYNDRMERESTEMESILKLSGLR